MFETIDVEAKRREAKQFPGVSYDKARNKFSAQIEINGERVSLGRSDTAAEAGLKYARAREENPIARKGPAKKLSGPKPLPPREEKISQVILCADEVAQVFGLVGETAPFDAFSDAVLSEMGKLDLSYPITQQGVRNVLRRDAWQAKHFGIDPNDGSVIAFLEPDEMLPEALLHTGNRQADRDARQANIREHGSVFGADALGIVGPWEHRAESG